MSSDSICPVGALIAVIIVVAVVVVAGIVIYNRLVRLRNRTDNAWAQVDVQLQRRYILIPNLVETVKGYAAHEQETFEQVVLARNAAPLPTWHNLPPEREQAFREALVDAPPELARHLRADIAERLRNIAKEEEHVFEGKRRQVMVHRKGATRSFGPESPGLPHMYRAIGQPVLIPGDMGTASYVLAGTEKAMEESSGSACHGAGRVMSRKAALAAPLSSGKTSKNLVFQAIFFCSMSFAAMIASTDFEQEPMWK